MNIGFDAVAILGPGSKNRGIGNYSFSQFLAMLQIDKDNHYYFFNLMEYDYQLDEYFGEADNLTCINYFCGKNNFMLKDKAYSNLIGNLLKKFIKDYEIDVFYITSPFDTNMLLYKEEWFADTNVVAIVYDIIPYIMKREYFVGSNAEKNFDLYMERIDMLRWMDQLQVISNSVKEDLINYLEFSAEKISVIYGAVDGIYQEIDVSEKRKTEIESKFKIDSPFIICTGGNDFRKNIDGLIIAYSKMKEKLIHQYQLVIVCKLSDDSVIRFENLIEQLQVKDRVILTNFVETDELLELYNMATLLAFPSKYEGFGLPVVEAWACGTPVLTSNNSSLGELSNGAAIQVNPYDTLDIKCGLERALCDTDLKALIQAGQERLKEFSWQKVAERSIKALGKITKKEYKKINLSQEFVLVAPGFENNPCVKQLTDHIIQDIKELNGSYSLFTADFPLKWDKEEVIIYIIGNDQESVQCNQLLSRNKGIVAIAMEDFYDLKKRNVEGKSPAEVELAHIISRECDFVIAEKKEVRRIILRNSIAVKVVEKLKQILPLQKSALSDHMLYLIGNNEIRNNQYSVKETRELVETLAKGK